MPALMLVALVLAAYRNSVAVPFLFDDYRKIVEEPAVHRLWPWSAVLGGTVRPVSRLTYALNYVAGGLDPSGYHAVNLLVHLLAALTLLGIVRRTACGPRGGLLESHAGWFGFACAALWAVHPLQTSAVTYLIQRDESLMGLFALVTLWAAIRSVTSPRPGRWTAMAALACTLGMATKPVMATVPLVVLCYDRVFLAGSFLTALRMRSKLYGMLAASWLVLAGLLWAGRDEYSYGAGFWFREVSWWDYVRTQPGVILQYLRLAVWPQGLTFDYQWPVATTPAAVVLPTLALTALLAMMGWAWRHRPTLGFLGVWVGLTLAPSSSVIPILDLAFEHRMYLPLAGLTILAVVGAAGGLHRLLPAQERLRRTAARVLLAAVLGGLGTATTLRNAVLADPVTLWRQTVAQRPGNPRAHSNLGQALAARGDLIGAVREFAIALELKPDYADARYNLASVFGPLGLWPETAVLLLQTIRLNPHHAAAYGNLAIALGVLGRPDEAALALQRARARSPDAPERLRLPESFQQTP